MSHHNHIQLDYLRGQDKSDPKPIKQSTALAIGSRFMDENLKHEMANKLAKPVLDGEASAKDVYGTLRFLRSVIEEAESQIFDEVAKVVDAKDGACGIDNVSLSYVNGGRQYDYKHDEEWSRLKAALTAREEKMKAAAQTGSTGIIDGDEVIPPAKVTRKKDSIKMTLK